MTTTSAHEDRQLPWHDDLWQQVMRARQARRMAHGLLVCGPPGVGKRRFAERLAQALLCHAPTAAGDACGQCAGCRQWQAGSHPDVSTLVPAQADAPIRVDAMRAFTTRLQLTAQYDSGRLGWIDPAQALNTAAANSLLKTLEEPPAGTHLILIADQTDRLLPTIRSRCRLVRVPPASPALARDWLRARDVDTRDLDDNSVRMPLRLLSRTQDASAELEQQWRQQLGKVLCGRGDAVALAQRWAEQPPDALAQWLYRTVCALVEYRLTGAGLHDDTLARYAAAADMAALRQLAAQTGRMAYLQTTNTNWQLVIESILLGDNKVRGHVQLRRG